MCELFAMSANVPTDACFSFKGLMQRGGKTGPHKDGWGIGFYCAKRAQMFHDDRPCYDSSIAQLIANQPIKSEVVIGHIRQANSGAINLQNTHPFLRELWGRDWVCAHNGQLKNQPVCDQGYYQRVGSTDSEKAFVSILNHIRNEFPKKPKYMPPVWRRMHQLCMALNHFGVFNLVISNSTELMAFCSTKLFYLTRRAPFGVAELIDDDVTINFQAHTTEQDIVTVVATQPLTNNEHWVEMQAGQMIVLKKGQVVKQFYPEHAHNGSL